MRFLSVAFFYLFLLSANSVFASEEGHHLPSAAVDVFTIPGLNLPVSNSMIITWIVTLLLTLVVRMVTKSLKLVPSGLQNFAELVIGGIYDFAEGILGSKLCRCTFWFFSAIFIYILATNWFSLIPGVGSMGWGTVNADGKFVIETPLFRGGNADLNMTSAMAILFFIFWTFWAFKFNGCKGVVKELFGVKGNEITGALFYFVSVIFFFVGFLEIISICFRPISLMFRLYGNIYAGEVMMETMMGMGPIKGIFASLPIYFLETLVGFVQAMVFALLTSVFTLTMCQHEEKEG